MTPLVYFVRHGETDWNAEAACRVRPTSTSTRSAGARPTATAAAWPS